MTRPAQIRDVTDRDSSGAKATAASPLCTPRAPRRRQAATKAMPVPPGLVMDSRFNDPAVRVSGEDHQHSCAGARAPRLGRGEARSLAVNTCGSGNQTRDSGCLPGAVGALQSCASFSTTLSNRIRKMRPVEAALVQRRHVRTPPRVASLTSLRSARTTWKPAGPLFERLRAVRRSGDRPSTRGWLRVQFANGENAVVTASGV